MKRMDCIVLNEEDIREIIAKTFNTTIFDIEIEVSEGDPQYPQTSVCIKVFKS